MSCHPRLPCHASYPHTVFLPICLFASPSRGHARSRTRKLPILTHFSNLDLEEGRPSPPACVVYLPRTIPLHCAYTSMIVHSHKISRWICGNAEAAFCSFVVGRSIYSCVAWIHYPSFTAHSSIPPPPPPPLIMHSTLPARTVRPTLQTTRTIRELVVLQIPIIN